MVNWCKYFLDTQEALNSVAYYTHLVPIFILTLIGVYLFRKKQKESFNFFVFILSFTLWLIGDLIVWTSTNPHLITTFWSVLDFLEITTFLFGLNFFISLVGKERQSKLISIVLVIVSLPAFYLTIRGLSVVGFNHSVCEVIENPFLSFYNTILNIAVVISIVIISFLSLKNLYLKEEKKAILITGGALLLLFLTFSITGYIASQTGIYEIELYGLFAIPVFLLAIVFTIVRLNLFNLKLWSQQLIAYALVVLVASELFFTKNIIGFTLTSITVVMSIIFVVILTRSIKKENEARRQTEVLNRQLELTNARLKELDEQKTEFISLASHQLRGPLTAIKGYASMVLEGDFGEFSPQIKEAVETIYKSTQALVVIVGDYLDISRIEQGRMKYDFVDFDLRELVKTVVTEVTPNVSLSHLTLSFTDAEGDFLVRADQGKIKQVISNLIDNATKYTKQGGIVVSIGRDKRDNILITIKDTGVGIEKEVLPRLFEKFSRAPDASKANIMGTGLGLYVARKIIEAHRGKIWAESEGKGKGSAFYIELEPVHSSHHRPHFEEIQGNISKEE